jgi:uncharacterized membrane protein YccC
MATTQSPVMQALRDYWLSDYGRLLNACKTALALVIGMGICMRLELATPRTTMVSVVIVMANQQVGMAIARGIYRLTGMLVGCVVGLLLVVYFSQSFAAFFVVLSYWIACCVWGASFYRNYQSYAFVLAGYATAIVAVPAWANPYGIIDSVIYTLSEVTIAVVVGSMVSALVFPQSVAAALLASGQRHCNHLIGAFRAVLGTSQTPSELDALHLSLTSERTAIESLRSAAIFEDPELRQRTPILREITSEFLDVTTTLHAARKILQQALDSEDRDRAAMCRLALWVQGCIPAASPARDWSVQEIGGIDARLTACLEQLPRHVEEFAAPASRPQARASGLYAAFAAITQEALRDLILYLGYFATIRHPIADDRPARIDLPRGTRYTSTANRVAAIMAGGRALIVTALVAAAWYASGWDDGSTVVTGAAITSAFFTIFPNPAAASRLIFVGAVCGSLVACLFCFFVLPHLEGFPALAAALAPIIMAGSYMGSFPSIAPVGVGFNIYFCYVASISNPSVYDPTTQLDAAFAFCLGIGVAVLAFGVLVPPGSPWITRFYVRQMRRMVTTDACRAPVDEQALHRFESGIRDFVVQINSSASRHTVASDTTRRWGFTVLDVGSAAIKLRMLSTLPGAPLPLPWSAALERWLDAIARLFDTVSAERHAIALAATNDALGVLGETDTSGSHASASQLASLRAYLHVVHIELSDASSPLHPASKQA